MIEKYQELLHKCIDKQEDQDRLNRMKKNISKIKIKSNSTERRK